MRKRVRGERSPMGRLALSARALELAAAKLGRQVAALLPASSTALYAEYADGQSIVKAPKFAERLEAAETLGKDLYKAAEDASTWRRGGRPKKSARAYAVSQLVLAWKLTHGRYPSSGNKEFKSLFEAVLKPEKPPKDPRRLLREAISLAKRR